MVCDSRPVVCDSPPVVAREWINCQWFELKQNVGSGLVRDIHGKEFPEKGSVQCTAISTLDGFRLPKDALMEGVCLKSNTRQCLVPAWLPFSLQTFWDCQAQYFRNS
jgi:hypothetical protein